MQFLFMGLVVALITVLDQLSKFWVVENIPLYSQLDVIDGLFHLTYVQNTGAAFSSFQGMQWLFVLVFAVFAVVVAYLVDGSFSPFLYFRF